MGKNWTFTAKRTCAKRACAKPFPKMSTQHAVAKAPDVGMDIKSVGPPRQEEKCLDDLVRKTNPKSYFHQVKQVTFPDDPDEYGRPVPPLTCNQVDSNKFIEGIPFGGCVEKSGCDPIITEATVVEFKDPGLALKDTMVRTNVANQKAIRNYESVDKKVEQRQWDIQYWYDELAKETDEMAAEVDRLYKSKRLLAKALRETDLSLETALKCIEWRDRRYDTDCELDEIQRELYKEVEMIRCQQERMKETLATAEQLCKHTQGAIEKDKFNKFKTKQIENLCASLRSTSGGLQLYPGIEDQDPTITLPEQWGQISKESILASQAERLRSSNMRAEIENLVNNAKNGIFTQRDLINVLLKERLTKRRQELENLEEQMETNKAQTFAMEQNLEYIKKSIADKIPQKMVVQSRIHARNQRPDVENCRDAAQNRLLCGSGDFDKTVAELTETMRDVEQKLRQLMANRRQLSDKIAMTRKSIYIDEDQCLRTRENIFMEPREPTY